ncbi:hypothetical protein RND81_04G144600 [Saponaria officinalis]
MSVRNDNTLEVGLLDADEAKGLFKSQAGNKVDKEEYKTVTDRLLSKCGGLPLAIVVTANALKDKDLPNWKKFADELEKPISSQLVGGDHRETFSILATSYRFMESKEKRIFFVLCCLCPLGSFIPIKKLMRYGIGLDLFQHVNKLSEAIDQAHKWADELISSSMLLKTDFPGRWKIHDVVRAFGISFAAKDDGHKLLVDAIPRWMNKTTLTEYTAISLLSGNDHSRLTGIESDKLQILLLSSKVLSDIPSSFFGAMTNLEVLYLSNMNIKPKLPESIGKFQKLRTLYLEDCNLGDIKVIGELVNLSVLCLRNSHLEELPDEIGKLCNLRLLDLTGCNCKFRPALANILGRLSELEGLYMINSFKKHLKSNEDGETSYATGAIEFNNLHYLNELEMHIWHVEQLSIDAHFVKNLDKFIICVKHEEFYSTELEPVGSFRCILHISNIDMGEISGEETFKALLKKADRLRLKDTRSFMDLFKRLDNEGLPELRHLEIGSGSESENELSKLKGACDEEAPPGIFSNLQHLSIWSLEGLQYILPFAQAPCKLTEIKVRSCSSLNFIFIENANGDGRPAEKEETDVMELPFLKSLDLGYLNNLISLLGSGNGDGVEEHQVLFNPRIVFTSLELISLMVCPRIVKLWDKELGRSSFQSLKTIMIDRCEKLSSVGPLSIFSTLVQLESLIIVSCKSMHEVITTEETEELEIDSQVIIFPQLKNLLIGFSSNIKSFYGGSYKLEFPNLISLKLYDLDHLNKFVGSENSSVLFHEENLKCRRSVMKLRVYGIGIWMEEVIPYQTLFQC